jgi:hypothetical protein
VTFPATITVGSDGKIIPGVRKVCKVARGPQPDPVIFDVGVFHSPTFIGGFETTVVSHINLAFINVD